MRSKLRFCALCLALGVAGLLAKQALAEQYISQADFLAEAFQGNAFESKTYWLKPEDKTNAQKILGHSYAGLRVRYWQHQQTRAWILEEIGKERPIHIGIVIKQHTLDKLSILAFNESRGWEVKHAFFTEQFQQRQLQSNLDLDSKIDGITGATLSVRAVTNSARWALYLQQQVLASERATNP